MVKKSYSRKYKEWKEGDTFALNITNSALYNNRFLIFIKYDNLNWEETSSVSFRVKITKDNRLPKNYDEIEELEYIIVRLCPYENRFLPFSGLKTNEEIIKEREKIRYYPDEFGNLNIYTFDVCIERKALDVLDKMVYLGNFKFSSPEKEYIPFSRHNAGYYLLSVLEKNIIDAYENYNLKKSIFYNKKNLRAFKELETFIPATSKEIMQTIKDNGWDFNHETETEDSLTYVGGENEDPYEEK